MMNMFLLLSSLCFGFSVKTNEMGEELKWKQNPIEYKINLSNQRNLSEEEVEDSIAQSFMEWEGIRGAPLRFYYEGETTNNSSSYQDGVNIVVFREDWPDELDDDLLAITYTWSIEGGEIIAFDILINENYEWSLTGEAGKHDLKNAITHEIGHATGMNHSEMVDSTMYISSTEGEIIKRTLADDDIRGLQYLYSGIIYKNPPQCASLSSANLGLFGIIFVILLIFFRRKDA